MWKKLEAPTWEGTIFAVLAWEPTVYSRLPPQESQGVTGELHSSKCIPRFNKNYIVPVEPAFRLWRWGGRFLTRHAFCKSPPEPGFPFCCIWSAHTGVTPLNCRSQNAEPEVKYGESMKSFPSWNFRMTINQAWPWNQTTHYESQTPIGLDEWTSLADPKFVPKVFGPHPNAAHGASTKSIFFYPSRGNAHRNFCLPFLS